MTNHQYKSGSPITKVEWYKEKIADMGEPKTRTDWAILQVYKEIVDEYEWRHDERHHGERRPH